MKHLGKRGSIGMLISTWCGGVANIFHIVRDFEVAGLDDLQLASICPECLAAFQKGS